MTDPKPTATRQEREGVAVMIRMSDGLHRSIQLHSIDDGWRGKASPLICQLLTILADAHQDNALPSERLTAYLYRIIAQDAKKRKREPIHEGHEAHEGEGKTKDYFAQASHDLQKEGEPINLVKVSSCSESPEVLG